MTVSRTQPPVGYRLRAGQLAQAARGLIGREGTAETRVQAMAEAFSSRWGFGLSSGKAAVTTALEAMEMLRAGRRRVIIPAYSCYSIPSAILKAGLDPVPCDLAEGSFDYDYDALRGLLGPDVLCVLSVHLFGIPADTARLADLCRPAGIFVLEDAAQALGGIHDGRFLGTRGDVGLFSLGRGKALNCGAGGILITDVDDVAEAIRRRVEGLPRARVPAEIAVLGTLALLTLFISPRLYWLPSGMPWLKLGETIFHHDFPMQRLSAVSASMLRGWADELERLNAIRRESAAHYLREIPGAREFGTDVPYLRFPILMRTSARQRLLADPACRRLGIAPMYPATIAGITALPSRLTGYRLPEAERVASSLITLPTHPLLSAQDRARICQAVNAAASRSC